MTRAVRLSPESDAYVAASLEAGDYATVDEMVEAGLHLLRRQEAFRREMTRTLDAAAAEADRAGSVEVDDALAAFDAAFAQAAG